MLPLRLAVPLALVALGLAALWNAQMVGFRAPAFCSRLGRSFEKYGLVGYATALKLTAARGMASGPAPARSQCDAAADAYADAARLLLVQSAPEAGVSALHSALRVAPWRRDLRVRLVELQIARGDRASLRALTDLAYRQSNPHAQLALAGLLAARGRADDALALLARAAKRLPESHALHASQARLLLAGGMKAEAQAAAKQAAGSAQTLSERLASAELLRAAGAGGATRAELTWGHFLAEHSLTALLVACYLLVLAAPWIARRARRIGGRLRDWDGGLAPE